MKMRNVWFLALFLALAVMMAGCGSDNNGSEPSNDAGNKETVVGNQNQQKEAPKEEATPVPQPPNPDPVELVFYKANPAMTEENFQTFIAKPVKEQFPHVTIVKRDKSGNEYPEIAITGGIDIVLQGSAALYDLMEFDLLDDLNPYIRKYNQGLDSFHPVDMDLIERYAEKDELYALPFTGNYYALFYNKEIFDRFGKDYPTDNMTWEELTVIAADVTREAEGIQYRGFDPRGIGMIGLGLGLPFVDVETDKPTLDTAEWQRVFETAANIYRIPGNMLPSDGWNAAPAMFVEDGNLAMIAYWAPGVIGNLNKAYTEGLGFDWDMATYPAYEENLGKSAEANIGTLSLAAVSKHKDIAFQVLAFLTTSDKVQLLLAQSGTPPVSQTLDFQDQFGIDIPVLKGKHLEALFKTEMIPAHLKSEFDLDASVALGNEFKKVIWEGKDINTALRDAQETATAKIQAKLGQ